MRIVCQDLTTHQVVSLQRTAQAHREPSDQHPGLEENQRGFLRPGPDYETFSNSRYKRTECLEVGRFRGLTRRIYGSCVHGLGHRSRIPGDYVSY